MRTYAKAWYVVEFKLKQWAANLSSCEIKKLDTNSAWKSFNDGVFWISKALRQNLSLHVGHRDTRYANNLVKTRNLAIQYKDKNTPDNQLYQDNAKWQVFLASVVVNTKRKSSKNNVKQILENRLRLLDFFVLRH